MYIKFMKRILDIICSIILIIGLSWLLIIIAVLVKTTSKGKIFYSQKRIGKNKKEFYILKFRTMKITAPCDVPTHLLQNPGQFITSIGKILRKTSLDELPQLFNILKGDMSLVGPRPALWNQYDLIKERDLYKANTIKPGLTGWAQINGRDEIPIPIKARYDGEYIKNMSFIFDISCMLKTIVYVTKYKGIKEGATEGSKTSEESINNWG